MKKEETVLSLEGLSIANLFVTKHIVSALISNGVLNKEAMQHCFNSAKTELNKATLSITAEESNQIMALIWKDFIPNTPETPH